MLSIIVPTNRAGGLDILCDSLAAQTHQDFELLLADALYAYRHDIVVEHAQNYQFPIVHLDPGSDEKLSGSYMRSLNLALEHARGETVVFMPDFAHLHPDCLAMHAAEQAKHDAPVLLDHNMVRHPDVPGLPFYGQHRSPADSAEKFTAEVNATTERYVTGLKAGYLDKWLWSLGMVPDVGALPISHRHRPCATRGLDDYGWIALKNESYPLELLVEMNGFDEELDKSHTWQDQEFAWRLRARGVKVCNGPAETGLMTIVDPRPFLNVKTMREIHGSNKARCDADPGRAVNPEFDLRERRKARLSAC